MDGSWVDEHISQCCKEDRRWSKRDQQEDEAKQVKRKVEEIGVDDMYN